MRRPTRPAASAAGEGFAGERRRAGAGGDREMRRSGRVRWRRDEGCGRKAGRGKRVGEADVWGPRVSLPREALDEW